VNVTAQEIVLRLVLAAVFGALIGMERQWHHKNAGVKTHTLVALGAVGFSIVSVLGLGPNSAPTQLAVGVLTGIGFIGGGVIMRRGGSVQGITTAATLWATASLGLALGPGYYFLSLVLFLGILAVQLLLRGLDAWIDKRSPAHLEGPSHQLLVVFSAPAEPAVRRAIDAFTAQTGVLVCRSCEARSSPELSWELRVGLTGTRSQDLPALSRDLASQPGVVRVQWIALAADGSD
jgi:putative Mg2+ transporter-C (MgtC) family protein